MCIWDVCVLCVGGGVIITLPEKNVRRGSGKTVRVLAPE